MLGVRITTPNFFVCGELGRQPLIVNIKCRILCFWSKLVSSEKLSSKIYNLTYNLYKNGTNGLKWIDFIKKIFDEIGLLVLYLQINQKLTQIGLTFMPNKYSVTSLCNDGAEILLIHLEATFILFSNKNFVWTIPYQTHRSPQKIYSKTQSK